MISRRNSDFLIFVEIKPLLPVNQTIMYNALSLFLRDIMFASGYFTICVIASEILLGRVWEGTLSNRVTECCLVRKRVEPRRHFHTKEPLWIWYCSRQVTDSPYSPNRYFMPLTVSLASTSPPFVKFFPTVSTQTFQWFKSSLYPTPMPLHRCR